MSRPPLSIDDLAVLQRRTFDYFVHESNPHNGLIKDKTEEDSPASIAVVGLALSAYPVAVERGFMTRAEAIDRVLTTLHFFHDSDQSDAADSTGYKGFYYHFLDMKTGKRAGDSELSTIDTAFLAMGMLVARAYFSGHSAKERQVRHLAERLVDRIDWRWATNGQTTVSQAWKPKTGFTPSRWQGYDEGMFLYILALASERFPIPPQGYADWTSTYQWKAYHGDEYLFSGPLFTHQISHIWIDFRGIQDQYMREKGIDYFENSRRATYVQQRYAILNPGKYIGYNECCWGLSASDGPGEATRTVDGVQRHFLGYAARGVPDGPDDGTLAPWAVVSSLPFAPEIVLPTLHYFEEIHLHENNPYGFKGTFNPTFRHHHDPAKWWTSPYHFGINEGPIVLMIENFRSGLIWRLMRRCDRVITGLRRAGFSGGWLGS